mmetsp:Transcript_2888/g.4074  ORF Transcript_2888/g.4074 Transcript_2888/m.4074 type:complete len:322 (-) Transcript_2888:372-1337(-)
MQAFIQSILPPSECYILCPPPGCPVSPPNSYWLLKQTLYGLKCSPRHFYELATKKLKEIGLQQHPMSPCIFHGELLPDKSLPYLGLYVDDFIYFSSDLNVEKEFETRFSTQFEMELNEPIQHFLGIKFQCNKDPNGDITIHMGQKSFTDSLVYSANLQDPAVISPKTPYKAGFPVDKIPYYLSSSPLHPHEQATLVHTMQSYIGSLMWLSSCTRPDITTITNILAKYTTRPTPKHIEHVKHVIRYLKDTKSLGITFSSKSNNTKLESYVKFPLPSTISAFCDANWGPQDQSQPEPNTQQTLPLFKSKSLSGFVLFFHGPVH